MKKDKTLIPIGHYCYHIDYLYGGKDLKQGEIPIVTCPYSTYKGINNVNVPYCSYIDSLGWKNGFTDEEYNKLIEHYGSEDNVFEALELDLLWDQCKCCGENYDEDLGFTDEVLKTKKGQKEYKQFINDWIVRIKEIQKNK